MRYPADAFSFVWHTVWVLCVKAAPGLGLRRDYVFLFTCFVYAVSYSTVNPIMSRSTQVAARMAESDRPRWFTGLTREEFIS